MDDTVSMAGFHQKLVNSSSNLISNHIHRHVSGGVIKIIATVTDGITGKWSSYYEEKEHEAENRNESI